jgi:hypothetical protein
VQFGQRDSCSLPDVRIFVLDAILEHRGELLSVLLDLDVAHGPDSQRAQQGVSLVRGVLDEGVDGQQRHVLVLLGVVDNVELGHLLALQVGVLQALQHVHEEAGHITSD